MSVAAIEVANVAISRRARPNGSNEFLGTLSFIRARSFQSQVFDDNDARTRIDLAPDAIIMGTGTTYRKRSYARPNTMAMGRRITRAASQDTMNREAWLPF